MRRQPIRAGSDAYLETQAPRAATLYQYRER
jgi:hypothetical protein